MKKFLFSIVALLCLTAFSANAQIISYSQTKITKIKKEKEKEKKPGYFQQSVDLEFGGLSENINTAIGANYIAGYRFNDVVFLGGGVGLSMIDGYSYSDPYDACYYGEVQARLFANSRFYLTTTRLQPFFDISAGITYLEEERHYYEYNDWGIMLNPQFGVNYKIKEKLSFYINLGFQFMPLHDDETSYPLLKIGVTF